MQPNGNNSHSSKCREEQKKKDNFSRPQSLFERPLVSEKRFDFSLDLNEVKLFFFSFRKWENNNLSNIAQIKVLASTNKKIVRG